MKEQDLQETDELLEDDFEELVKEEIEDLVVRMNQQVKRANKKKPLKMRKNQNWN